MTTMPSSAALIGVPEDAPMSTPVCIREPPEIGWIRGPNPLPTEPFTGQMNRPSFVVDAGLGPGATTDGGPGFGPAAGAGAGAGAGGDGFPRLTLAAI